MQRANGKWWIARKPPRAMLLNDDVRVLVVRCPDRAEAWALAARELRAYDSSLKPGAGYFNWWRQGIERGDPYWRHDPVRGAPGWMFDAVDS